MAMITGVAALGGLGFVLATLLVLANLRLRVEEDPRVGRVEDMLPRANCGACGQAGCRAFAEALVAGAADPGSCTVASSAAVAEVATFLGIGVGVRTRRVARLACAGGDNVAPRRAHYRGPESCLEAAQVAGGGKACAWGCIGFGDCVRACGFAAISLDEHSLPQVDPERCTACGDCVAVCPRDLFSLQPEHSRLFVACSSRESGERVTGQCAVGCTACERCTRDAPEALTMDNNLPRVDLIAAASERAAIERCPTGAIVWLDDAGRGERGAGARPVLRRTPLAELAT